MLSIEPCASAWVPGQGSSRVFSPGYDSTRDQLGLADGGGSGDPLAATVPAQGIYHTLGSLLETGGTRLLGNGVSGRPCSAGWRVEVGKNFDELRTTWPSQGFSRVCVCSLQCLGVVLKALHIQV